jgi:hypothetical protein
VRRFNRRPSPAMVVACLALLVALGGTSVAAISQIPRNSVGTPQLRTNAVTTPKVRNNAIVSAKVRNRSLLAVDFAVGQIPQGPQGEQGPAGPAGPAGAQGPPGPNGRWAHVNSAGSIVAQSGGITAVQGGATFWFVTFTGATVVDKPVVVSASRLDGTIPPASIEATPCGGPPQGIVCSLNNNQNTVLVNASAATAFYVMVIP